MCLNPAGPGQIKELPPSPDKLRHYLPVCGACTMSVLKALCAAHVSATIYNACLSLGNGCMLLSAKLCMGWSQHKQQMAALLLKWALTLCHAGRLELYLGADRIGFVLGSSRRFARSILLICLSVCALRLHVLPPRPVVHAYLPCLCL